MEIKEVIDKYDAIWTGLTALAALILSFIAKIIDTPPTLWREAAQVPYVAELVVIVVLAAGIAGSSSARRSKIVWVLPLVLTLVCACAYYVLTAQFSCPFTVSRMAVGWSFLPSASEYISKNPGQDCSLLIADFIGSTNRIWPTHQIVIMWGIIYLLYVATVVSASMALVGAIRNLASR